jgi:hypothetical protein
LRERLRGANVNARGKVNRTVVVNTGSKGSRQYASATQTTKDVEGDSHDHGEKGGDKNG